MGESRQELVNWLNSLLQLNITKVEQCGTGAALCQVFDSIFLDLPMSRVKFNVNTEYAYIQNFKVLQNAFAKHGVEKPIPVESLVKCKMQDNLEFLQWSKKYWDMHFPDHEYDAVARRKGVALPPTGTGPRIPPGSRKETTPTSGPRIGAGRTSGATSAVLQQEVASLKESVSSLEREREFYYGKLRDIELLIQHAIDEDPEVEKLENGIVKQIQAVLYTTEDGFEIPAEEEVEDHETF